jgi:hypothetical protein
MFGESFFDIRIAYRNFISARDCSKINSYLGIYRIFFASAFGGCKLHRDIIRYELAKIESLDPTELIILGVNTATYPFLLIAIHKSIIYGNMEFTDKLIEIAKKIAGDSKASDEAWLNFYEKIYNELHNVVRKSKSKKSYSQVVRALSDQIQCDGVVNKYKCKILAILGDLEKYDEIRYEKADDGLSLYHTIDSDLEYISKKFDFINKLKTYRNSLMNENEAKVRSKGVPIFLSYFFSGAIFRKSWDEYWEDRKRKIIEKKRVVPTILLINSKRTK